jgi:hypothetical protein
VHREARVLEDRGRVDESPVPRLLVGLRGEGLTGSVEIREDSGRPSTLYLRQGLPVHVVRPDTLDRLDLVLVQAGLLTSDDLARAQLVRESTGQLMGQVLQQLGLVLPPQLSEALRLQLRRKVTRLCRDLAGVLHHLPGRPPLRPGPRLTRGSGRRARAGLSRDPLQLQPGIGWPPRWRRSPAGGSGSCKWGAPS